MPAVTPPQPLPVWDETGPRAILRDGSVATLRIATSTDHEAVRRFFHDLSPESRRRRFFGIAEPSDSFIARWCDDSDPTQAQTLLAIRAVDGELKPIAVGSYISVGAASAEVAFAVDDRFQGNGIGTILLEHLAAMAVARGIRRFEATTLPENSAMLDVFRDSGFEIRSKSEQGTIVVQLSLSPTEGSVIAAERREAAAAAASVRALLEPSAVAVIGASRDPSSIGGRTLHALITSGFSGAIYPINPNAAEIEGLRCYATIDVAPPGIDMAVVAVPRDRLLAVVDQCAAAGVKGLVVITAGFAERDEAGAILQQQLVEAVRAHGMRLIGPNCMGLLNARSDVRLNASFSPIVPPSGCVALASQSGALGIAILRLAADRRVGISTFVSVGNKADVSGNDLLQYWESDPSTEVILLYVESFGNPRRFQRLARRIGRKKPIVCVKAGRTSAGSRAANSHTAALAAKETAVDALFHQAGIVRADTIDEMFDVAACLASQPLPRGKRIAIVTNAGGPGILAADACQAAGLEIPTFSDDTQARLAGFLPAEGNVCNPVDMIASAGATEYRRAIEAALTSTDVDALIVIHTPVDPDASGAAIDAIGAGVAAARRAGAAGKPVVACLMASRAWPEPIRAGQETIPAYAFPENAARALAKVSAYARWRQQTPGLLWAFDDVRVEEARAICRLAVRSRGDGWLTADETSVLLGAFGLPAAAGTIARSADEAVALARVIGFPVAAKLASRGVQHKSDVGGVRLNLTSDQAVRQAYTDITALTCRLGESIADADAVLIQSMVNGGVETMIGVVDDPAFGPLVCFGLGGIHVEILGDVQFRIAPLTDRDADELVDGIRGRALLHGYRGHPAADVDALRDLILRVSRLAADVAEIAELDLNPVIALPRGHGCRIVDARVRVRAHA